MNEKDLEIENLEIEIDLQKNNLKRTELRIKKIRFDAEQQVKGHEEAKERLTNKISDLENKLADLQAEG